MVDFIERYLAKGKNALETEDAQWRLEWKWITLCLKLQNKS